MRRYHLASLFLALTTIQLAIPALALPAGTETSVKVGEIGLEGTVQSVDQKSGEISISASAFETPTGRKDLPTKKPKTLLVNESTLIYDKETQTDLVLGDLEIGTPIRVVGKDNGTGKPLVARLLSWKKAEFLEPPDPDTPRALVKILPPSKAVDGVRFRVFNAGFEADKKMFSWGSRETPMFYMAFRVFPPDGQRRRWWDWARFIDLTSPEGDSILSSGADVMGNGVNGRALTFPKVDPRWKTVLANWEVMASNAPPSAHGEFETGVSLKGPAPTPENPKVEPKTVFMSAKGTALILKSIECDYEKKKTTIVVSIDKPEDIPDLKVDIHTYAISDGQGTNFPPHGRNLGKEIRYEMSILPAPGSQSISLSLNLQEAAKSLRQEEFFKKVSVVLPVAAIAKANPPAPRVDSKMISYSTRGESFEALLEEFRVDDENWTGKLWVRPDLEPNVQPGKPRKVIRATYEGKVITKDGREIYLPVYESTEHYFHIDNTPASEHETISTVQVRLRDHGTNEPVQLKLEATSYQEIRRFWTEPLLSVPKLGSPITNPATDKRHGVLLKKIVQVRDKEAEDIGLRTGGEVQPPRTGAIVLVYEVDRLIPDGTLRMDGSRVGKPDYSGGGMQRFVLGDVLTGEKTPGLCSVVLSFQGEMPTQLMVRMEFREVGPQSKPMPFVFKDVRLKPAK